jgi:cysteine desulfurase
LNQRYYLDYNATSPISTEVLDFLRNGAFTFANPSSLHFFGKSSRKSITYCTDKILQLFNLSNDFKCLFHSGATEGANLIIQGVLNSGDHFIFLNCDHPCITEQVSVLESQGVVCHGLNPLPTGEFPTDKLETLMDSIAGTKTILLNYTWVHNETGFVWPLELAQVLKLKYKNLLIHVDAVQSVGKIEKWEHLLETLDFYTYSTHKFGGLKGTGFTLHKIAHKIKPLFYGGAQQNSLRPGTENVQGAEISHLALQAMLTTQQENFSSILELKKKILHLIDRYVVKVGSGEVLFDESFEYANNTICFFYYKHKADQTLIQFDLAGLAISSGSACSSGSINASRILVALGKSEYAKNAIRISLGPANIEFQEEILNRMEKVLQKLA